MRRSVLITLIAMVMGSNALPVAASTAPAFSLFLYPSKVLVGVGRNDVTLGLLNNGTDPVHVTVNPSEPWLVPDVTSFTLAPSASRQTAVHITRPDASGDLDATVAFMVAPTGSGTLLVARGLAAIIVVQTGQGVRHGLSWSGLTVPSFIDPMAGSVRLSVTAHNTGNVHEVLDPVSGTVGGFFPLQAPTAQRARGVRFTPTILLRDSSRVLLADWNPPVACWCSVSVRGQSVSVLVLPIRAILVVILLIAALVGASRLIRRRRALSS